MRRYVFQFAFATGVLVLLAAMHPAGRDPVRVHRAANPPSAGVRVVELPGEPSVSTTSREVASVMTVASQDSAALMPPVRMPQHEGTGSVAAETKPWTPLGFDPAGVAKLTRDWGLSLDQAPEVFRVLAEHRAAISQVGLRASASGQPLGEADYQPVVERTEAALRGIVNPAQLELIRRTPLAASPISLSPDSPR